jgi:hypothetical protein
MKELLKLAVIAFSVTLGAVVANRMSGEAMAVVIGVVCGVLASIPMSVIILILTRRRGERDAERRRETYPPVVVINPGSQQPQVNQLPSTFPTYPLEASPRQFKIIGQDEAPYER